MEWSFSMAVNFACSWICEAMMDILMSRAGTVAWIQGTIAIQEVSEECHHNSVRLAGEGGER